MSSQRITRAISKQPEVLVAEDDPEQSDMLRELLEDEGFVVDTAFSGDAALHKLLRQQYRLVILDVRMPGVDGVTVLKKLREKDKEVPILMVSAFASPYDLKSYKQSGATACLAKPYEIDQLLGVICALTHAPRGEGGVA